MLPVSSCDMYVMQVQFDQKVAAVKSQMSAQNSALQSYITDALSKQKELIEKLYKDLDSATERTNALQDMLKESNTAIGLLKEENMLLLESLQQTREKYKILDTFVQVCTDELPRLLTRISVVSGNPEIAGDVQTIQDKLH